MAAASAAPAWASAETLSVAATAARLCKADLASSTVTEMTALAGTMGRHYAYKQVGTCRYTQASPPPPSRSKDEAGMLTPCGAAAVCPTQLLHATFSGCNCLGDRLYLYGVVPRCSSQGPCIHKRTALTLFPLRELTDALL